MKGTTRGMFRNLGVLALLLILAAWRPAARAADFSPPLQPERLMFHLSLRSVNEFIETADRTAAAATKGSSVQMLPGMLMMLAQLYNPFPGDTWNRDGEFHLVLSTPDHPVDLYHAFYIATKPLAEFLQALEDEGVEIDRDGETPIVMVRDFGEYLVEDAGGGLTLFASNQAMLDAVHEAVAAGWRPRHSGDGVLHLAGRVPEKWATEVGIGGEFAQAIDRIRDRVEDSTLSEDGRLDADAAGRVLDAAEAAAGLFVKELDALQGVSLDLGAKDNLLGFSFRFAFAPGSYDGDLAAAAGGLPNVDNPLGKNIASGALTAVACAPMYGLAPEVWRRLTADMADIGAKIDPVFSESMARRQIEFLKAGGKVATGTYYADKKSYNATWIEADDPDKFIADYAAAFADFGSALEKNLAKGDLAVRVEIADGTAGDGTAYKRIVMKPVNPEAFHRTLAELLDLEDNPQALAGLRDVVILLAKKDKAVALVSGQAGESELAAALAVAGGSAEPMLETPGARAALELSLIHI